MSDGLNDYKKLAYTIIQAEKFQDLHLVSWNDLDKHGIIYSLRTGED